MGHGFFRMPSGDVRGLAPASPGPSRRAGSRAGLVVALSDEQTIAGHCAVFTAIEAMGSSPDHYEGWGVVAASRFLGSCQPGALRCGSFMAEGVWGTSPHLIPHFALHSASGTISLGLGSHGPNLGVGGGLHAAAEGFLAALTWLSSALCPASGWSSAAGHRSWFRSGRATRHTGRMPGPCAGAGRLADWVGGPWLQGGRRLGLPSHAPHPLDLVALAERLESPG